MHEFTAPGFAINDRGAQVTQFQPGAHPVFYSSSLAQLSATKAWRGGVPICVPWFAAGPRGDRAPSHGPARIALWERKTAGPALTEHWLRLAEDALGRAADLQLIARTHRSADAFTSTLEVRNVGATEAVVECALHSYFAVSDVCEVGVSGLAEVPYFDKVVGGWEGAPLRFGGVVDRIYADGTAPVEIQDAGWGRTLRIERGGATATVVWNPGSDATTVWNPESPVTPADVGPGEWRGFVCVEAACVAIPGEWNAAVDPLSDAALSQRPGPASMPQPPGPASAPQRPGPASVPQPMRPASVPQPITLAPGATHTLTSRVTVVPHAAA